MQVQARTLTTIFVVGPIYVVAGLRLEEVRDDEPDKKSPPCETPSKV